MAKKDKLLNKSSESASRMTPEHSQHITKDRIKELLPKKTNVAVTDELIHLLQNMENDTGLPQELLEEDFLGYLHLVTVQGSTNSLKELVNAIKFCNLKRNYTNKEAWSIVFPEKYAQLVQDNKAVDNFVSMFNNSKLVVAVDKEMLIPVHIQYAPYFHAAVKKQFELMNGRGTANGKDGKPMQVTPMVQHLAAKELATLTKQPEENKLSIDINPGAAAMSMQEEMNAQLKQLVKGQKERLDAGENILDVQVVDINFDEIQPIKED